MAMDEYDFIFYTMIILSVAFLVFCLGIVGEYIYEEYCIEYTYENLTGVLYGVSSEDMSTLVPISNGKTVTFVPVINTEYYANTSLGKISCSYEVYSHPKINESIIITKNVNASELYCSVVQ